MPNRSYAKRTPEFNRLSHAVFEYEKNPNDEMLKEIDKAIKAGGDPLTKLTPGGDNLLFNSIYCNLPKVVEVILKYVNPFNSRMLADVNIPGHGTKEYSQDPLQFAISFKKPEIVKLLLPYMECKLSEKELSPLHLAALNKDPDMLRDLLNHTCNPNHEDSFIGKNAYEWADRFGGDEFKGFNFHAHDSAKE